MPTIRVGLISDTHGLLRPEAVAAMHGAHHIIHAGDICTPATLDSLRCIAPLTVVRGNNDWGPWAEQLPETARLHLGEVDILVVHDLETLTIDPAVSAIRVVVAGHSHRPLVETRSGVLYVNPGSAGPRRFRLPISVGQLVISGSQVQAELRELTVD